MQITLTLPCWYAYKLLINYDRDTFAEYQMYKKFGAETMIEDFDAFVDFFQAVSHVESEELHDDNYLYFGVSTRHSHQELVLRLIRSALELTCDEEDCYERRKLADERVSYEQRLEEKRVARCAYHLDKALESYLATDYPRDWRYESDDLDYEIRQYLSRKITLEDALLHSYTEQHYRKIYNFE